MVDTYTTRNRITKPEPGAYTNSWGGVLNNQTFDMFDAAIDGKASYTLSGTKTLSSANGTTDEARMKVQHITGGTGGTITIPAVEKTYFVINDASASVYFTCGGVQAQIPASSRLWVYCNATDCYAQTPIEYAAAAEANYSSASVSTMTIGTGVQTCTIESGKVWQAGDYCFVKDAAAPNTNWMYGTVTTYDDASGALALNITEVLGSGAIAGWLINLSGIQGASGDTLPTLGGNAGKVLQVASGATSTEWVDRGWVQIATASPSAVASYAFTAISSAYTDLYLYCNPITNTNATEIGIQVSPDSSSYSSTSNLTAAAAGTYYGGIQFSRYNGNGGFGLSGLETSATTYVGTTSTHLTWSSAGGIDAIKLIVTAGTISGTLTLYGRR